MKALHVSILVFVGTLVIVYATRPSLLFKSDGSTYDGLTISSRGISMPVFVMVLVTFSYAFSNRHP